MQTRTCHCPNHVEATGAWLLHVVGSPGCVAAPVERTEVEMRVRERQIELGVIDPDEGEASAEAGNGTRSRR
jgi:hypothetical protein